MVAQLILDQFVLVRIQAGQPLKISLISHDVSFSKSSVLSICYRIFDFRQ